jgi:hypothetical protein
VVWRKKRKIGHEQPVPGEEVEVEAEVKQTKELYGNPQPQEQQHELSAFALPEMPSGAPTPELSTETECQREGA